MPEQEQNYFCVSLHFLYASVLEVAKGWIVIHITTVLFKITVWYITSSVFLVLKYSM